MEQSTKMVEELTNKRKMTSSVKAVLRKNIFNNVIVAILLVIFNLAINMIYLYAQSELSNILLKVFPLVGILITIILFEIAYKKDNGKIVIFGIECFINSIIILYLPKIYEHIDYFICKIFLFFPIFCVIYYCIKSVIIYKKTEFNYRDNLSDVKEIMKED